MSGPTPFDKSGIPLFTEESPGIVQLADLLDYINEMRDLYYETQQALQEAQSYHYYTSVKEFGAKGDGINDDYSAIQNTINDVASKGGGTVYLPAGSYFISSTLEMKTSVNLVGNGSRNTVIKKSSINGGVDAVIKGTNINSFRIEKIRVIGNRTDFANNNNVTTHGIYLDTCSYYALNDITALYCLNGFRIKKCWVGDLRKLTAQQSQEFGFYFSDSCTSHNITNPTCWGTGGGWRFESCVYMTVSSSACDLNCAGGRPDDPFLPIGSGGNYLSPKHIFQVIGSKVTIISAGAESGFSQFLYAEGAEVTITSPYIWNMKNYATTARFIETRGNTVSNVNIISPSFIDISNQVASSPTIYGIYVENPTKQKVKLSNFVKISDSYGLYEYSKNGIEYAYKNVLYDLDQYKLKIGDFSPFVPQSQNASVAIVDESGVKYTKFLNSTTSAQYYRVPLPKTGTIKMNLVGKFNSSYATLQVRIIETDGTTTNTLKTYTNNINDVNVDEYVTLNSTMNVFLEIRNSHDTDNIRFSTIKVTEIL